MRWYTPVQSDGVRHRTTRLDVGFVGVPNGVEVPIDSMFSRNIELRGGSAPVRTYIPELLDDVLVVSQFQTWDHERSMPGTVLLFVALWASGLCDPYEDAVRQAAGELGLSLKVLDVDEFPELAKTHGFLNVPAVVVEGDTANQPIIGVRKVDALTALLEQRLPL